jgi:hypothetical protein
MYYAIYLTYGRGTLYEHVRKEDVSDLRSDIDCDRPGLDVFAAECDCKVCRTVRRTIRRTLEASCAR